MKHKPHLKLVNFSPSEYINTAMTYETAMNMSLPDIESLLNIGYTQ